MNALSESSVAFILLVKDAWQPLSLEIRAQCQIPSESCLATNPQSEGNAEFNLFSKEV